MYMQKKAHAIGTLPCYLFFQLHPYAKQGKIVNLNLRCIKNQILSLCHKNATLQFTAKKPCDRACDTRLRGSVRNVIVPRYHRRVNSISLTPERSMPHKCGISHLQLRRCHSSELNRATICGDFS